MSPLPARKKPAAAPAKKRPAPRPRRSKTRGDGTAAIWMTPSERHKVLLAWVLLVLTFGGVALASGELLRNSAGGWGCRFRDPRGHIWFTIPLSPSFAHAPAPVDDPREGFK